MMVGAPALVLASASETRRRLLASTGLAFEAVAAWVDEDSVKREARVLGAAPEATALQLARLKAQAVGRPEAIVIGCDQILVCGGQWFDKPVSLEAAAAQLRSCAACGGARMCWPPQWWCFAAVWRFGSM